MKNILISGVSRGVGRALAQHYSSKGFYIYGGYKWSEHYSDEQEEADSLKNELQNITLLPCDFADRGALETFLQKLDGVELTAIIHNAAEFLENSWSDFSEENWERSLSVNVSAPLIISQKLKENIVDGGSIVNIVSTDAYYAAYDDIGYAASKAALISITKSMAAAFGPRNIRVNAIAPSWVETQMLENADVSEYAHYQTPLGRDAHPQEIVNVAEFLISNKSSFITGSVVNVDGGYSTTDYTVKKESEKS